jgi:hypothetical protein
MENIFLDLTRRAGLGALAVAVLAAASGCASTILSANLSQYNNGTDLANVSQNIPGTPNGDFVTDIISPVVVTSGGTTLLNGNKLRVNGRVNYRPAEHEVPQQYQVVWRGLRDNHSATPTFIRLQDSSGRNAVVLRFERDRLTARNAPDSEASFAMNRTHDVSILIFLQGAIRRVRVSITEQDQGTAIPLYTSQPLDLMDTDFSRLDVVQFESASDANYFVQDLRVLVNN